MKILEITDTANIIVIDHDGNEFTATNTTTNEVTVINKECVEVVANFDNVFISHKADFMTRVQEQHEVFNADHMCY
jgi:hypothetical protein